MHLACATPNRRFLEKEAFLWSAATRRRFAVRDMSRAVGLFLRAIREDLAKTARHVVQLQSGIMLPHSKGDIVFLRLLL